MLNISGLDNGIVLDHIPAGMRMPAAKKWARKISSRLQAALTVSISMSSVS